MDDNKAMEKFANNLWDNFLRNKAESLLKSGLSGFRAEIVANQGDGTLTVTRPFDYDGSGTPINITIPCAGSMISADVGEQVLCISFGNMSNSFVLCKADLSNL